MNSTTMSRGTGSSVRSCTSSFQQHIISIHLCQFLHAHDRCVFQSRGLARSVVAGHPPDQPPR